MAKKKTAGMKITASKEVFGCKIFRVTEDEASDGKGFDVKRCVVRHAGSAVMLGGRREESCAAGEAVSSARGAVPVGDSRGEDRRGRDCGARPQSAS